MSIPEYDAMAIKCARRRGRRAEQFIGGDPHDAPMAMDCFVRLIRSGKRSIPVDTRFTAEVGTKRRREYPRKPKDAVEGYDWLRRFADSPRHVIPGHDPLVMARYPAVSPLLDGIAVRLDVMPRE